MQHNNNIENKLREMEAMEQPDLSQVDSHWQQMQAMLQPTVMPAKKIWPKWMLNALSAAAVVILISTATWYLSSRKNDEAKNVVKQNEIIAKESSATSNVPVTKQVTPTDTAIVAAVIHTPTIDPSLIYEDMGNGEAKEWTEDDSILASIKLNVVPCGTCPDKKDEIVLSNAERQLKLQTLFTQLEKEEQHFTIDNSRDTLLQFEEGAVLLVPANSFGGINGIEISAKEFYKTSDIVLNQLNTASNKEQLETGGMLELQAMYKGDAVKIQGEKLLTLFMPERKNDMANMQLFYGEKNTQSISTPVVQFDENLDDITKRPVLNSINWIARPQYFLRRKVITEARVLNLANIPWLVHETSKKKVGYFIYDEDSLAMDKNDLKKVLKEKYGYTKVKLRSSIRNVFLITYGDTDKSLFDRDYSEHIGDSIWMNKADANRYKLDIIATRKKVIEEITSVSTKISSQAGPMTMFLEIQQDTAIGELRKIFSVPDEINSRYSVNLSQLGWINCDRFYADSRRKVNYKVDIGDTATNYYTMLVFENMRSMMTGYMDDNKVVFQNIPVNEPVKVISIGINKKGETVYSVTHTTTSEQELKGLQFQTTSAPELKASLSKYDN